MIGVISDMHLKERLSYSDYIEDKRIPEREEILDFIVDTFKDCDTIVFGGDQLNSRNNTSEILRYFVNFLERFKDKKLYILAGNHEKFGDGRSALDFLKEIKNKPNWTIITDGVITVGKMIFCPYFTKSELGVKTDEQGTKKIMKMLKEGDILFCHHAISNTVTTSGCQTNIFREIVLPKDELEKMYRLVVGGHIHQPQADKKTIVAGSVFNNEMSETQKYIWKINQDNFSVQQIKLPGRGVYKAENPTIESLKDIKKDNIVKAIFTDIKKKDTVEVIKKELKKFDAYLILEQYPNQRKKVHFEEGMLEFDTEELLKVYAKEKNVDFKRLKSGLDLIEQSN